MSLLHRNVLSQILAAVDPLIETGAAIFNPLAGAGAKLVLTDVESIVNGDTPAPASAPVAVVVPASPAPVAAPAPAAAAPAPGSAAELALALSAVLAKYLPK